VLRRGRRRRGRWNGDSRPGPAGSPPRRRVCATGEAGSLRPCAATRPRFHADLRANPRQEHHRSRYGTVSKQLGGRGRRRGARAGRRPAAARRGRCRRQQRQRQSRPATGASRCAMCAKAIRLRSSTMTPDEDGGATRVGRSGGARDTPRVPGRRGQCREISSPFMDHRRRQRQARGTARRPARLSRHRVGDKARSVPGRVEDVGVDTAPVGWWTSVIKKWATQDRRQMVKKRRRSWSGQQAVARRGRPEGTRQDP
jgi:hypothetical protein